MGLVPSGVPGSRVQLGASDLERLAIARRRPGCRVSRCRHRKVRRLEGRQSDRREPDASHLPRQGQERCHAAHRRRLQRLGDHGRGLRRIDRQDDAPRGHVVVVSREHVVHERAAGVRLPLRQGGGSGSAESTDRPGVCGAALGSADAVLRRTARGRRDRLGAEGRTHRRHRSSRDRSAASGACGFTCRRVTSRRKTRSIRSSTCSTERTTSRRWTCRRCSII